MLVYTFICVNNFHLCSICMYISMVLKDEDVFTMEIPLGVISSIEKVGRSKKKDGLYGLELHCKVRMLVITDSTLHMFAILG